MTALVKNHLRICFNHQSFHIESMGCLGRVFSILLIVVLTVSSLMMAESAFAQTPTASPTPIPTPSIPTFTLQLIDPPYLQPTTYQLDQNTGQIVANVGFSNEYSAVEVIIKNQPLVFDYSNVHLIGAFGFYYNIQIKPHSSNGDWIDIYHAWDYGYGVPSNSEYTNLSFSIEGQMGVGVLAGTQIDIQVQAMIGEIGRDAGSIPAPWVFRGQTSDWSNTQTISIPANVPIPSSSNSTPNPTATAIDNISDNSITSMLTSLVLVALVVSAIVVVSLLLYVRHLKRSIAKPGNSAV